MAGRWIFGYGSLVSPVSLGRTIGRVPRLRVDAFEAALVGYGRRWNYATAFEFTAATPGATVALWTAVALGLERVADESANGVVAWVDDAELATLDRRERRYDRVDVTECCRPDHDLPVSAPIQTYVPHPTAVADFEAARQVGSAAVTQHYWDLVDEAFDALGGDHRARYRATTPPPDIPIVTVPTDQIPARHRTHVR